MIIIPAIINYYYVKPQKILDENGVNYTHRDLEVMKMFGQASASGYAFEERLIPVIDSLGYDTKYAVFYKEKGEYPPEYLNKSGAGDGGLDLIALSHDSILLCQCKFYNGKVAASVIAQMCTTRKIFERWYKSKGDYRKVSLMIVTNSSYDSTARANAKEEGIILVDGAGLIEMTKKGKFGKKAA
jgi:predicted helicase